MQLQLQTWPEVEAYLRTSRGIIMPIGSTEQHGPIGLIGAAAVCAGVIAEEVGEGAGAVVGPPIAAPPKPRRSPRRWHPGASMPTPPITAAHSPTAASAPTRHWRPPKRADVFTMLPLRRSPGTIWAGLPREGCEGILRP